MPGGLLGSPTPIATPDQAWHPEALDWRNRVRANGGDVSQDTMAAVNRFCTDIDAAGLRGRFYRVNLFCGSNLLSCLVPLYRATSPGIATLGNATDTNSNFVAADYVEHGNPFAGLKGNGSSKALNTGLNPVTIGASISSFHLSVAVSGTEASGTTRVMIGNGVTASGSVYLGLTAGGSQERFGSTASILQATGGGVGVEGFIGGNVGPNETGGEELVTPRYYRNGTSIARAAAFALLAHNNAAIWVCATPEGFYSLRRYFRGYSIGLSMSPAQWFAYSTIMQRFQSSLGRTA